MALYAYEHPAPPSHAPLSLVPGHGAHTHRDDSPIDGQLRAETCLFVVAMGIDLGRAGLDLDRVIDRIAKR
jgi:hypothetical protein